MAFEGCILESVRLFAILLGVLHGLGRVKHAVNATASTDLAKDCKDSQEPVEICALWEILGLLSVSS